MEKVKAANNGTSGGGNSLQQSHDRPVRKRRRIVIDIANIEVIAPPESVQQEMIDDPIIMKLPAKKVSPSSTERVNNPSTSIRQESTIPASSLESSPSSNNDSQGQSVEGRVHAEHQSSTQEQIEEKMSLIQTNMQRTKDTETISPNDEDVTKTANNDNGGCHQTTLKKKNGVWWESMPARDLERWLLKELEKVITDDEEKEMNQQQQQQQVNAEQHQDETSFVGNLSSDDEYVTTDTVLIQTTNNETNNDNESISDAGPTTRQKQTTTTTSTRHGDTKPLEQTKPWWENWSTKDLERWVMKRFDDMITCREEEEYVMNYLDQQINKQEQKEVMQHLLQKVIYSEEKTEQQSSDMSMIYSTTNIQDEKRTVPIEDIDHSRILSQDVSDSANMATPKIRNDNSKIGNSDRRRMMEEVSESENAANTETKKVTTKTGNNDDRRELQEMSNSVTIANTETGEVTSTTNDVEANETINVRLALPKWVPKQDGSYAEDNPGLLFTIDEYRAAVIDPVVENLPANIRDNFATWTVSISQEHPDDPFSYYLQARGPKDVIPKFRQLTENFIRAKLACINIEKILNDDLSLVLDVSLDLRNKIGLCYNFYASKKTGIWIKEIKPGQGLASALGGLELSESGLVLMAIDGKEVCSEFNANSYILNAKKDDRKTILLTFCLPRYADLTKLPPRLLQNIRRKDGKAYDEISYTNSKKRENTGGSTNIGNEEHEVNCEKESTSEQHAKMTRSEKVHASYTKGPMNDKWNNFYEFKQKFKPVIQLEFQDTKINEHTIYSSMWTKHKKLFGDNTLCSKHCDCISVLSQLVGNVILDHINKPKVKDVHFESEPKLKRLCFGIIDHFIPRFLGLLQNEYPNESMETLIKRLVDMWSLHQKNRIYGMRCTEKCACQEDWEQLFGKGDIHKAEEFLRKSTKNNKMEHSTKTHIRQQNTTQAAGKRKLSSSALEIPDDSHCGGVQTSPPPKFPIRKRPRLPFYKHGRDKPSDVKHKLPFEVAFDTTMPLGGYFISRRGPDGLPLCCLYSKQSGGQIDKDQRILLGSAVNSVLLGENKIPITSFSELQSFCESASRTRRQLRVIFEYKTSYSSYGSSADDWTVEGTWVGARQDGWAGGSKITSHGGNTWEENQQKQQLRGSVSVTTNISGKKQRRRCSETTEGSRSSPQDIGLHSSSPSLSKHPIIGAVTHGSCKVLIEALQSWFPNNRKEVELLLQSQYDFVKNEIVRTKRMPPNHSIANREDDLEAKRHILKIYINCIHDINKSMSLKGWNIIEFQLKRLKLSHNTIVDRTRSKLVSVTVRMKHPDSVLGCIPERELSKVIRFSDRNDNICMTAHNNHMDLLEHRLLVLDVSIGSRTGPIAPLEIGSFTFSLNEIENLCQSSANFVPVSKHLSNVGEITLMARRRSADSKYISKKKDELAIAFQHHVEMIEHFNNNQKAPSDNRLTARIRGIDGISLLHAAVNLMDSATLVEKLLALEADPLLLTGNCETPVELARKVVDRAHNKEHNAIKLQKPQLVIGAYKERCIQATQILNVLESRIGNPHLSDVNSQ